MSFSHDIAGGNGNLVVTSLKSPNYDPGAGTGWAVNKDGSATFYSISLPGFAAGVKVTFSSTAPPAPNVGDLWYDVSDGLLLSQWNGSAWVPYQVGTGGIAPGAVTPGLLSPLVTSRSIGGIITTIAATPPVAPVTGDLWLNSANGYQMNQWSGTAWAPVTWTASDVIAAGSITAGQIAAGTITASQLAAGIVYAGIVNSTTITGAVINGGTFNGTNWTENSSGQFLYSGTPATGNLIASIAAAAGTDAFGNTYGPGIYAHGANASAAGLAVSSGQAIIDLSSAGRVHATADATVFASTLNSGLVNELTLTVITSGKESGNDDAAVQMFSESADGTIPARVIVEFGGSIFMTVTRTGIVLPGGGTPPAVAGSSSVYATSAGTLQVVDGIDGQAYGTQRRSIVTPSDQNVSSGTFGAVMSSTVASTTGTRAYRIEGLAYIVPAGSTGKCALEWTGPAGVSGKVAISYSTAGILSEITSASNLGPGSSVQPSFTMTSGQLILARVSGSVTVPAGSSGQFSIQAATTGSTFAVASHSYLDIMPA